MHWCQEQAITYPWIAKAVEDGFLCQRQLCHCLRSKVMIKTQVYVPVYLHMKTVFADLKASSLSFLLENICSSSNASCLQTSICGSKNINDENLESFIVHGNRVEGTEFGTSCSKLHRTCHFTSGIVMI